MARSSFSLLPASEIAGALDGAGAGGSSEAAAAAATGTSGTGISGEVDVVVAAGAERGRVDCVATLRAGCAFCVGWDEVNRAKSSRMFRAASQPDKSNNPTPTVCLTSLLILIPPT